MAKAFRPDVLKSGGRSGEKVIGIVGPPDSYLRGEADHVFETDAQGKVTRDISVRRINLRKDHTAPDGRIFPRMVEQVERPTAADMAILRRMGAIK